MSGSLGFACHPRVAQLRGYPTPSKPSLPQEYVQVTPKICRSSNKRGASADLTQLVGWVSQKVQKNVLQPEPEACQPGHRVPFRNVQNLDRPNEDISSPVAKTKKKTRPLPLPPTDIITGSHTAKFDCTGSLARTPTSTTFILGSPHPVFSPPPTPPLGRGRFPSGFIDTVHGYSEMADYLHANDNHEDDIENDYPQTSYERPVSRRGLYRFPVESYSDSAYSDIHPNAFDRVRDAGLGNMEDKQLEESDIGEASPLDIDMEDEEMTRELIKMLDF